MSRLYYRLYLTISGALALALIATALAVQFGGGPRLYIEQIFARTTKLASEIRLSGDTDPAIRRAFLEQIGATFGVEIALFSADHRLIDRAGGLQSPSPGGEDNANPKADLPPTAGIRLSDGAWLAIWPASSWPAPFFYRNVGIGLAVIGIMVAVLCFPVVRYLTSRLERLQLSVETLGTGNLTARVKVEGNDEVAYLARSFNRAAAQIESLIAAHRMLLADVSHELRTPLSRLRLTAEFLQDVADPKRKADLQNDVREIDALLEEILLSSRLNSLGELEVREEVDLLALAAEEAMRCSEHDVMGDAATICGDPALLRRVIRNLVENAQKHGAPPIKVRVRREGSQVVLSVSDNGRGFDAGEQERVFAPFYRPAGTSAHGSGLGLALVRQIARQHGGDAQIVQSAICASLIEVTLPSAGSGIAGPCVDRVAR